MATELPDSQITHGMKGYVIAAAANRDSKGDLGSPIDIHRPIPHNIVESVEGEGFKVVALSSEALTQLQQTNVSSNGLPTSKTMDYYGAIAALKAPAQIPVNVDRSTVVTLPGPAVVLPAPTVVPAGVITASVAAPVVISSPPPPPRPRVAVKFTGSFGSLSVPYNQVFVDGVCLVMVQDEADSSFYVAPVQTESPIKVEFLGRAYWCLPGVQYTMPGRTVCHTVYLITEEIIGEDSNGNAKGQ